MPNEETHEDREIRLQNLERILLNPFNRDIVASNYLRENESLFGELGKNAGNSYYEGAMVSDEAQRVRNKLYEEEKKEKKRLGIADEVPYTDNYRVVKKIMEMRDSAFLGLPLKRLEESIKKVVPGLEFKVPNELRDATGTELVMKQMYGNDLSEAEKHILNVIGYLKSAYTSSLALNQVNQGHLAGLNAHGKTLEEAYLKMTGRGAGEAGQGVE